MSEYNTKNYTEQGGEITHFGGKVIFEDGCEVEGLEGGGYSLPTASASTKGGVKVGDGLEISSEKLKVASATESKLGGVKKMPNQAASTATELAALVENFNSLLSAMKAAGIMTADA